MISQIKKELKSKANSEKAKILQRFFKTQPGSYGEGDIFLGVTVPETRKLAIKYKDINLQEVKLLLESKIHEERLLGVLILVQKYQETNDNNIVNFYKEHNQKINNWDLVDLSADKIIGKYYFNNKSKITELYSLAKSNNLWEKRTSIVSTYYFIKNNQFKHTIAISKILLKDNHDLIQKAVGWMLREVGKRNESVLRQFLKQYSKTMPRTMLRYAIEKLSEIERKKYLSKK
ncbi:DNA alkylation repair protein [Candidatus Pacearchaeota archaeon]|nr:DNA alkylation repair protein [Candidatus Pacearchaeota archaeon]